MENMLARNKVSMKTSKAKIIRKELLINGGDLDLYLDVFLTDKEGNTKQIFTKKADSILANFMRILYVQMGRDNRDNVLGGIFYRYGDVRLASSISSITNNGSGLVRITGASTIFSAYPTNGKITLGGFQGIALDGRYDYVKISASVIDIVDSTYSAGWTVGTGGWTAYFPLTNIGNPDQQSFRNIGIVIGTGDAPVVIDDQLLEKQVPSGSTNGALTYGTSTVSQDTNNSNSAQLTFTRTFTNNASLTVGTKEIGLLLLGGGNTLLAMRDVFPSEVSVAQGVTLTVNYRIKTVLDTGTDPGGFLASFMRLLYRQAGNVGRAIFDIDNVSRTVESTSSAFCAIKAGGLNIENPNLGELQPSYRIGIVLGRGGDAVSMGDYYLQTPIPHGKGANEMLYYGGFAEDFIIGANYAEFSISKAMENASGSSIDINEYVLTGASSTGTIGTGAHYIAWIFSLTRNVLSSPVTVDDGEFVKVVYTLRCVVGGVSS